jgi:hypothetical protein
MQPGDSHYDSLDYDAYYAKAEKYSSRALYRGDKIPVLYKKLPLLNKVFPDSKKILMLRDIYDVASSYMHRLNNQNGNWKEGVESAVQSWNESLIAVDNLRDGSDFHLVSYEDLFVRGVGLEKIYDFLGLDLTSSVSSRHKDLLLTSKRKQVKRVNILSEDERKYISDVADFERYRKFTSVSTE